MSEKRQISQRKNLLAVPNFRNAEASGTTDSTRMPDADQAPPKSHGLDQRRAVLRAPIVTGERLGEGEFVFADEHESEFSNDDLFGSDAAIAPVHAFDQLRRVNWLIVSFSTIIVASFLLLALSQTALLAREVASLPWPANWIGFGSIAVVWVGIAVASWQLVSTFVRLKRTPAVSLSSLSLLRSRASDRKLARSSAIMAEARIREFLERYPRDRNQIKLLRISGVTGDTITIDDFLERFEGLLQIDDGVPDQWLEKVRHQIILPLDDAATQLIRRSALQVGTATAISPRGSLDALIVLIHSFKLVNDLCRLYGVRLGGVETCCILAQVFLSVLLAAGGDQAADKVEEQMRESLQQSLGLVAGSVVSKLGARLGEGTVNALFVRRIGKTLKDNLCPIGK